MTEVLLIRPGATLYDEQRRVQGVLDIPLSDRGRTEAARLAESLIGVELSALYCGPGESTRATAEIVGKALGLRPRTVAELRNLNQGLWQGLQIDELKRRHLRVYRRWIEDPRTICPPQGESVVEALERIQTVLRPMIRRHRDETIGLVAGEPVARLIASYLRREPHVQLDHSQPTGGCERIPVVADLGRNGDHL